MRVGLYIIMALGRGMGDIRYQLQHLHLFYGENIVIYFSVAPHSYDFSNQYLLCVTSFLFPF